MGNKKMWLYNLDDKQKSGEELVYPAYSQP
jgi:hypothetical protein